VSTGSERNLGRRLLFAVVVIAALVISYLVGAAVVPRWWAQRNKNKAAELEAELGSKDDGIA